MRNTGSEALRWHCKVAERRSTANPATWIRQAEHSGDLCLAAQPELSTPCIGLDYGMRKLPRTLVCASCGDR